MRRQSGQLNSPPFLQVPSSQKVQRLRKEHGKASGLGVQYLRGQSQLIVTTSINTILSSFRLSNGLVHLLQWIRDSPLELIECVIILANFMKQSVDHYKDHKNLQRLKEVAHMFFGTPQMKIILPPNYEQTFIVGCRYFAMMIWYLLLDLPRDVNCLLKSLPIVDPGTFALETNSRKSPLIVQNIDRLEREWGTCPLYSSIMISLTFFDENEQHQTELDHAFVCIKIDMNHDNYDTLLFSMWNTQKTIIVRNFHHHLVEPLTNLQNIPLFYFQTFEAQQFRQRRPDHDQVRVVIQRIIYRDPPSVSNIRHNKQVLLSKIEKGGISAQSYGGSRGQQLPPRQHQPIKVQLQKLISHG